MRHGSLFSGIGGFDLAADWMGWENVFHCEWNKFGQQVLHYYWPKAICYEDITKTDFSIYRGNIDIISGGFPCQPYSSAGKRLGKEDERHLWPEMLRAIREIQPRWVVGENVRGLTNWNGGMVFDEVQSDLEVEGYEVTPFLLPACAVNAPHKRDRIWFVAYCECSRLEHRNKTRNISSKERKTRREGSQSTNDFKTNGNGKWNVADTTGIGGNENEWRGNGESNVTNEISETRNVANTRKNGLQQCEDTSKMEGGQTEIQGQRNKSTLQFKTTSNIRNWETFPTVSPICNGDDGISDRLDNITFPKWRNESIKAGGNAVVPQVVHQIFKAIEQYERTKTTN